MSLHTSLNYEFDTTDRAGNGYQLTHPETGELVYVIQYDVTGQVFVVLDPELCVISEWVHLEAAKYAALALFIDNQ